MFGGMGIILGPGLRKDTLPGAAPAPTICLASLPLSFASIVLTVSSRVLSSRLRMSSLISGSYKPEISLKRMIESAYEMSLLHSHFSLKLQCAATPLSLVKK